MSPAVAGEQLFIGSCSGTFFAFDAKTGDVLWSYATEQDGTGAQFHGDAIVTDDLIVVGSDAQPVAYLYAFERATGEVRWNLPFRGGVASDVRRRGETIFAAAVSGEVVALDLASGDRRWQVDDAPQAARGARSGDPALSGDRLIVPWRPGVVDAFAVATGERVWRGAIGATLNTSAVVVGEQVLVGSLDGHLYRLRLANGEALAPIPVYGAFYGGLIVTTRCLLALWAEGGVDQEMSFGGPHVIACLDAESGEQKWRYESTEEWTTMRPLVRGAELILGYEGQLLGLDLADGSLRWQREIPSLPRGLSASPELLYVGTLAGPVLAMPVR